jgi:hypothetical protein
MEPSNDHEREIAAYSTSGRFHKGRSITLPSPPN